MRNVGAIMGKQLKWLSVSDCPPSSGDWVIMGGEHGIMTASCGSPAWEESKPSHYIPVSTLPKIPKGINERSKCSKSLNRRVKVLKIPCWCVPSFFINRDEFMRCVSDTHSVEFGGRYGFYYDRYEKVAWVQCQFGSYRIPSIGDFLLELELLSFKPLENFARDGLERLEKCCKLPNFLLKQVDNERWYRELRRLRLDTTKMMRSV